MTEQVKQYPFNYDGEDDYDILKKVHWNNYIEYLKDWARQHEEPENEGMSPACYEEFLSNESEEL